MITNKKDTFVSTVLSDVQNPQNYEVIDYNRKEKEHYDVVYSFGQRKLFWISKSYFNELFRIYQTPILYWFTNDFIVSNKENIEEEMVTFVKDELMNPNGLSMFIESGYDICHLNLIEDNFKGIVLAKNIQLTKKLSEVILKETKLSNLLLIEKENEWFVLERITRLKKKTQEIDEERLSSQKLSQATNLLLESFKENYLGVNFFPLLTKQLVNFAEIFPTLNDFYDSTIITETLQLIYKQFGSFLDIETTVEHSFEVIKLISLVDESLLSKEELIEWTHQKLKCFANLNLYNISEAELFYLKNILSSLYNNTLPQMNEIIEVEFLPTSFFYFLKTLDEFNSEPVKGVLLNFTFNNIRILQILNHLNLPPLLKRLQKYTHSGLFTEETVTVLEKLQEEIKIKLK